MIHNKINPHIKWTILLAALLWAALLFLLFGGGTYADRPTEEEQTIQTAKTALASTVKIEPAIGEHGSGFFISSDRILTNWHVVTYADTVTVTYSDKSRCTGRVGYREEKLDLAIITGCVGTPLGFAKSFQTGQSVLTIGSPHLYDFTVSKGVVCGENFDRIQVDANVWNGNSGGPLVNLQGDVIGVITEKSTQGAYGFAIPSNEVVKFIKRSKEE